MPLIRQDRSSAAKVVAQGLFVAPGPAVEGPANGTAPRGCPRLAPELIGRVASGSLVGLVGTTLGRIARFALNLVVAKALGAAAYGLFSLGFSAVTLLQTVAGLGQRMATRKYIAEYRTRDQRGHLKGFLWLSLKITLLSGAVTMAGLWCAGGWLARHVFHAPEFASVLKLFSLAVPPLLLLSLAAGVAQGLTRIDRSVLVEDLLFPVSSVLLAALFLWWGWHLTGAVLALAVAAAAAALVGWRWIFRSVPELTAPGLVARTESQRILRFSWQTTLIMAACTLFTCLDVLVLGCFQPPDQVALYSAPARIAAQFGVVYPGLISIYSPLASALFAQKKTRELEKLFQVATEWLLAICLFLLVALAALSQPILGLFGPEFVAATPVFLILLVGNAFGSITVLSSYTLMMTGLQRLDLYNHLVVGTLATASLFVAAPRWGAMGAGAVISGSMVLINLLKLFQMHRYLGMRPWSARYLRPLAAAAGYTAVVLLLGRAAVFQAGMASALWPLLLGLPVYAGIVFLWRAPDDDVIYQMLRDRWSGWWGRALGPRPSTGQ